MGLEPDARLVINSEVDLRQLPLTPVDFFLYSRVEALSGAAAPSVAEVIAASGQLEATAMRALEKLVQLGALEQTEAVEEAPVARSSASAAGPSTPVPGQELRERARDRRRGVLQAQMRALQGTKPDLDGATNTEDGDLGPGLPIARPTPAADDSALTSIFDVVEPVAATDPRLERGASVDLDRQRRLLALRDSLRHIGHFELLGLGPTNDTKAIRRAYHTISREFHPDSHYGKNLGSFADVLDALFRRARASYEILMDVERREPLVEAHLVKVRAAQERSAREAAAAAAAHERMDQARREAEAEAAQAAQEARAGRDRERGNRIRDRALAQRRRQAKQHAEQAVREQESGRHGTAATLFRLAHEHDPSNGEYEQRWRESLTIARRQRAESSYEQGRQARRGGRVHDAARLLGDAADADPSLRNLAEAANALADVDAARAREYAMAALEALAQAKSKGAQLDTRTVAGVHHNCAKAFLAAGQVASAKEQAERAHALAPSEHTRTLLNSIKLA